MLDGPSLVRMQRGGGYIFSHTDAVFHCTFANCLNPSVGANSPVTTTEDVNCTYCGGRQTCSADTNSQDLELGQGMIVTIHDLVDATQYNGMCGVIVGQIVDQKRWMVQVPASARLLGVKADNLQYSIMDMDVNGHICSGDLDHSESSLMRGGCRTAQALPHVRV